MTAIASAVPHAATAPAPANTRPAGPRTEGFSAALDALAAGEGKARSTEDDGKQATDDPSDSASTQPSSDLRAALIGGALASLAFAPAVASVGGATPAGGGAAGMAGGYAARSTAPAAGVTSTKTETPVSRAAGEATPPASAAAGATLTAERSYLAPAASPPLLRVAEKTWGDAVSTFNASAAANRAEPAPVGAETVHGRSATTLPARTSAGSSASPRDTPCAASSLSAADGTVSPVAPASRPASAALPPAATASAVTSAFRPAATAAGAPRRAAPAPSRESGSTPTAASRSSGASAPATAATSGPAKAHVDSGLDGSVADQPAPRPPVVGAPTVQADASSFGAAPAQGAFASSDSARQPAEAGSPTRAPTAATTPLADKIREIDLDLAPSGLKDVTMTVRLAGDKLGVVVRAASGESAATIEGARDAITERLAAIGQPVTSFTIQQTGASDAKGATGQSAGDGDGGATREGRGEPGDPRGSRRGASRF